MLRIAGWLFPTRGFTGLRLTESFRLLIYSTLIAKDAFRLVWRSVKYRDPVIGIQ